MRARFLLLILILTGCGGGPPQELMGAWRFDDGEVVSIRASADDSLRYRLLSSGRTGRLYPEHSQYVSGDGFSVRAPVTLRVAFDRDLTAAAVALRWDPEDGQPRQARRIGSERWLDFESDGTTLSGRLTLPDGPGPHPVMVLVHGSGSDAATAFYYNGDFFAASGIAAFVYDKRGTGRSGGEFTFDFEQLARDAAAAIDAIRAQTEIDPTRVGLSGYSQGGWVAPRAALLRPDIRGVLVSCGLVASPAEEARVETRQKVIRRGADPQKLDGLDELTAASVKLVASGFRDGWDELRTIKSRTEGAPWRKLLAGTPQQTLLSMPRWLVRLIGPRRAPKGMNWDYDSMTVLRSLELPMVWFVAEEDLSAPPELTLPYLRELERCKVVVVPNADHAMLLFEEQPGERVYTAYARGYFSSEVAAAQRMLQR